MDRENKVHGVKSYIDWEKMRKTMVEKGITGPIIMIRSFDLVSELDYTATLSGQG